MQKVYLSIILACYNEGPTLENSVYKIVKAVRKSRRPFEIIFVEDKSTDGTLNNIQKIVSKISNSKLIVHKKNTGRGKAVSDGIIAARGEICGYLDVDLEISENYIPIFTKEIEKGFDMAIGKRFYESDLKSIIRLWASRVYSQIVKVMLKIEIDDTEAGYKFFRRKKILPLLKKVRDKEWFWDTEISAVAFMNKLKISQVPVLFVRRHDKKSTVRLLPDTYKYLVKIIKFRFK